MKGTVVVTDYEFADLELEMGILNSAGYEMIPAQARTAADLIEVCAPADGVINQYAQISKEVIAGLDRVKVISRYGIGVNTIDVNAATKAGIAVANVPDGSLNEVSEHAAAMILSLARGLGELGTSVRSGGWDYTAAGDLFRICGRTLGLIGFGNIPQKLVGKLSGFGLNVIAYDPYADPAVAAACGVHLLSLDEVLTAAHFVSIHVPLIPATEHLIGARELEMMRSDAVLINTSRGPVVDESALVAALRSRQIMGAGLDVFESEPLSAQHPLCSLPNVVLSPHTAWYSKDSEVEIRRKAVENAIEVLDGRNCSRLVNRVGSGAL
ncbi:C-terminal binding protein [Brevibacterium aurantiacum]|uniref:C-terminal binding protein n=1 Tax=Brevibacterium aurantiacum TaxID=273384 RepID=A0A556CA63_BREAU|nr:C-terminal binding protein [Brevibacterium aurantiacum]TSI13918.1 C-terminal binding protein [Brevibacterium aurantiacum]